MLQDLRNDLPRTVAGSVMVVLAAALAALLTRHGFAFPVGFALLPVLGVALLCGPEATAVVSLVALASFLGFYALVPTEGWVLRMVPVVGIVALAVAASAVRRRNERRLVRQAEELALAREHELTADVTQQMLERVAELSGSTTVEDVWRQAVAQGRAVFGAAMGQYWQVDDDGSSRLCACEPIGLLPDGHRLSTELLQAGALGEARDTRTLWVTRDSEPDGSQRARRMDGSHTVAWSSTPIRVDGRTVGHLTLGWTHPAPTAGPAWLDLLDRYGDQVALAKTVVRRRAAQGEAQRLGLRLQRALLPQVDVQACGAEVRTLYRPGVRDLLLGGDFLDVIAMPEGGGVRFLIGDVSGHGPEPAALAATMRAAWQAMAALPQLDLEDWTAGLDSVIAEQSGDDGGSLVTLLMGTVDLRSLQLHYADAGHPPPIVLGGAEPLIGPMSGPPLGVHPGVKLRSHCVPLQPDSSVLMVTDGIFEGRAAAGFPDRVGYDEFVEEAGRIDPRQRGYLERLADTMTLRNGGPMADDVAAVLISLNPDASLGQLLGPEHPQPAA